MKIYNILHVEDDDIFINMINQMLKNNIFNIDIAYNGSEAVTKVFRNNYDLILMDIMMPIMDGNVATKTIKSMCPDLPIIALTACDLDQIKEENFDFILRKPIRKNTLIEKINYFLKIK